MVTTSPTATNPNEKHLKLIPKGKGVNDIPGENPNRIIPFSMGRSEEMPGRRYHGARNKEENKAS